MNVRRGLNESQLIVAEFDGQLGKSGPTDGQASGCWPFIQRITGRVMTERKHLGAQHIRNNNCYQFLVWDPATMHIRCERIHGWESIELINWWANLHFWPPRTW